MLDINILLLDFNLHFLTIEKLQLQQELRTHAS